MPSNDDSSQQGKRDSLAKRAGKGLKAAVLWIRKADPRLYHYIGANIAILAAGIALLCAGGSGSTTSDVGASLLAAGFTGIVFLLYQTVLYRDDDQARQLHKVGLEAVYLDRLEAKDEYPEQLAGARRSIDILAFGLKNFREDFDGIGRWWNGQPDVRILLLSPTFPGDGHSYANQRDEEENQGAGQIAADVRNFVRYLRRELGENSHEKGKAVAQWQDAKYGSTLELRLAECIPAITVFRIDEVAYWGPYLISRASRKSPTIKVRSGRPLFDAIEDHFKDIWTKWSTDIPTAWLEDPAP